MAKMRRPTRSGRQFPAGLVKRRTELAVLLLDAARSVGGVTHLAERLGVRYQSVYGWARRGFLPASEWTGGTRYAFEIQAATGGEVQAAELLAFRPQARTKESRSA